MGGAAALACALFAGVLLALQGGALRFPFLADDYFFYDETRPGSGWNPIEAISLTENYFRPVGRELYFFVLSRLFGPRPLLFHLFNFALLLACVGLVLALARRLLGTRAAVLAAGTYVLLYSHRVLLAWVSCSQDLLAAVLGLTAVLLYGRGRRVWAAIAFGVGLFAKESIAALPLVLVLWEAWQAPRRSGSGARLALGLRRTAPLWAAAFVWVTIVLVVRSLRHAWLHAGEALPVADVVLKPGSLWLGLRLALLTYFDLDQPLSYLGAAAAKVALPVIAMGLAVVAVFLTRGMPRTEEEEKEAGPASSAGWKLGLLWAVVGALPVALVGHHYSAYYVCFSAVGFALVVGSLLARAPWPAAAAVLAVFVWGDAVANRVEAFRVARETEEPTGVSYVSIARLEWQRKFVDSLHGALAGDPPPRGAVIYLSHAPSYLALATFGAHGPRIWFDDPTLDLSYITHYAAVDSTKPRRFVSFDTGRWSFVALSNELVDAMVAGEGALSHGRPAEARAALARALALTPSSAVAERAELANTYGLASYQTGDTAEARRAWQEALALDPANRGALLNLAAWSAGHGDFPQARALALTALRQEPDDPLALYYLARIERALGNNAGATSVWQSLVAAQPGFADSVARRDGTP
jgi:tetratricopeptide (TPR) repeat protein